MEYKELFEKVRAILNQDDPIGLIGYGAPKDEYDGEVRQIILKIGEMDSLENATDEIYKIFVGMFNDTIAGSKEKYRDIAEKMLRLNIDIEKDEDVTIV